MADKISFDLVSPEKLLLSEEAVMVTIPGTEGEMGVMAGHAPVITTLRPGTIRVSGGASPVDTYFVAGGFAEINAAKITVLAEEAVPLKELDAAALELRITSAMATLEGAKLETDRIKGQLVLDFLYTLRTTH